MKKFIKIAALAMALVLTIFCFAACKTNDTDLDANNDVNNTVTTDFDYIKNKGELIVGMTDYAPMNYKDENGKWIGFDTEFAEAVAAKLGVNVKFFELADWGAKVNELNTKNIDCVWNGMTILDELKQSMDISNPYVVNAQVIVCKNSNKDVYTNEEAIKNAKIAVEGGSAAEKLVEGFANVTPCQNMAATLLEVNSGTCDVAIIDITMAKTMIGEGTSYADLCYTGSLSEEQYGIGFRKGSDLCAKVNAIMEEFKADGTLQNLATKYGVTLVD